MTLSNEFINYCQTLQNPYIKDWISNGGKVIGYYCTYLPEEILHAANFLPYRIRGIENSDSLQADVYLSKFNCSYVRSTLNLFFNQKYNFLNGVVIGNTCDHIRRIFDILKIKDEEYKSGKNSLFFLSFPHAFSEEGLEWMRSEILLFIKNLSEHYNLAIKNEEIKNSITIYNENSRLIHQINTFRQGSTPKLSGLDFLKITLSNNSVRKEHANIHLKQIIKELEDANPLPIEKLRARIMVLGSNIDNPNFFELIENSGGLIVSDNICSGLRSTLDVPVWDALKAPKDEIDVIIKNTYLQTLCPRIMNGHDARMNFIKRELKRNKVEGIILQRVEFCDLHGCENAITQHELEEELKIPVLNLDRDYFLSDFGRLKTRLEAFFERIGK